MNLFGRTTRIFVTLLAIAGLAVHSAFAEICLMPCGQEAPQAAPSCCDSKPAPAPAAKVHKPCGIAQEGSSPASPRMSVNGEVCACDHQAPLAVISAAMPVSGHRLQAPILAELNSWQRILPATVPGLPTLCDTSPAGSPPAFLEHCSYLC